MTLSQLLTKEPWQALGKATHGLPKAGTWERSADWLSLHTGGLLESPLPGELLPVSEELEGGGCVVP